MSTSGILIIGNEILSGKVRDENLPFLLPELRKLGVSVDRVHVIPDDVDLIAADVRRFSEAFTYVLTTGGVGPTHDDVTMAGIAQALDRKLVPHPHMEALLRRTMREVEPNASQLKMCEVPEQARLIDSPDLWFPLVVIENVYVFPGVPKLLRKKFESAREHFKGQPFFLRQVFVRCMESDIAQDLNALLVDYPELALGSYPQMHEGHYRTLLTLESHDESYVVRALDALLARIPESQLLGVE